LNTIWHHTVIFCKYNTSKLDILTIVKKIYLYSAPNILELTAMFGYRTRKPECYSVTERLLLRLACETDAYRLADYYCRNENFLKPWEPIRDSSYYQPAAWSKRLHIMAEMHRRKSAFHFILLDKRQTEVIGVINFSNIIRGAFKACYS